MRIALLRASYRRVSVEALEECPLGEFPSTGEAIRAAVKAHMSRGDSVATLILGDKLFVRRVDLPPTAMKQLAEVLPFELEAQLPFDLEDAIYDSRLLPRAGANAPVSVFACVARIEHIQERIDVIHAAINNEPERVDGSAFVLANLVSMVPELGAPGPIGVVHLDATTTDVAVLREGQVEFVRTVTGGTAGLPASAKPLARDLRQTLLSWRSLGGEPLQMVYLTGPGATYQGAEAYLSSEIGVEVAPLPAVRSEGAPAELLDKMPRFTRAIGLALGLTRGARSMNLRQGPLAYERGFGFLREKVPLLAGIGALIFTSFLFATWMELRTLGQQTEVLEEALASVTTEVVGEPIRDPGMAEDAVSVTTSKLDDPMPTIDGFDLMVEISKAVPPDVTHDIEEFDYQKGEATIKGIVPTIPDAQQIASTLGDVKCFQDVKIVRTNQVVNEDRQKYVLSFEVKCPVADEKKKGEGETSEGSEGEEDEDK
ncbi:MAG: type IV pilus biogenesis protein PilM [Myxococcota bacterium]